MEFRNIKFEKKEGGIGIITIDRKEARNALDHQTLKEINCVLDIAIMDEEIFVLIFTGAGDKVFVSGADIRALREKKPLDMLSPNNLQDILFRFEDFSKPIIAAINGFALGGGCELAMACDIRIASDRARFGQPEVNLGIIPAAGGTQRLSRLIGIAKSKELIFTGRIIDAIEAEKIGLVNQVVPSENLMDTAIEMAKLIVTKAPIAIQLAKKAINAAFLNKNGFEIERLSQSILFSTKDKLEGATAFLEKRVPKFKGE